MTTAGASTEFESPATSVPRTARLIGRAAECQVLAGLFERSAGQGGALVLRGESGVGKTTLIEHAIAATAGLRVVRAVGLEAELDLPFAALHRLSVPLLDRVDLLPEPQRAALETAYGLRVGDMPDRFLVGLAMLGLLLAAADEMPLVCVVDDAQWLDRESARVLAFVARRIQTMPVVLLFAMIELDAEFAAIPELALDGLSVDHAHQLLGSVLQRPLDQRVREQIVAETRGNPRSLLELPRGLTPAQMAGGFGLVAAWGPSAGIQDSVERRLRPLAAQARLSLLVAALEPIGDAGLVWAACERLAVTPEALAAAQETGLLDVGAQLRFPHPLVRSAIFRTASADQRRRVHAALAEVTNPIADADRRAWHLAHAASGPDEQVAAELECAAGSAQRRGGCAAAAAFLQRAVELTPEPAQRRRRALAAARALHLAGAPNEARMLVAIAQSGELDEVGRAGVSLLLGQIAESESRPTDALPLLLAAANELERHDPALAREAYLDALSAAQFAGERTRGDDLLSAARAASAAPARPGPQRPGDALLEGLATRLTAGRVAATPIFKRALKECASAAEPDEAALHWMWLAAHAAAEVWDHEACDGVAARHFALARRTGTLGVLPRALGIRVAVHAFAGELSAAADVIDDVHETAATTGSYLPPYGPLALAAWRGREVEVSTLIDTITLEAPAGGDGFGRVVSGWARAVLHNGLGRYDDALAAAERACEPPAQLGFSNWALVELVAAAAGAGRPERASEAIVALAQTTAASGGDWALGIEARSRALLSVGDSAERLHREAIERLARTDLRVELARARLQYGEWLHREGRQREAREQLRAARATFTESGVESFAARAERELLAAGERRGRCAETRGELTDQELQVARLACEGLSNREIGARLFISRRTVEYHLRKVFMKVNVPSRNQLADALARERCLIDSR